MNDLSCNHLTNHLAIVNSSGLISPCCQFKDFRQPKNYKTIFNTETLDNILELGFWNNTREFLAKGEQIKNCESCWTVETGGSESKRMWINKITEPTVPFQLEDLEIGLDYTCNMMCRICKPSQSSKWNNSKAAQDLYARRPSIYLKQNTSDYQDRLKNILENTNLKNLKRIRLVGGEPFYSKNFAWLVDKLERETDIKNLEFALNTNGSIFPKEDLLAKILKMRKVSIHFSLDATDEVADCIRWGIDWKTIKQNIEEWIELGKKYKNLKLSVHATISILNVNKLQTLVDFCDQRKLHMNYSTLTDPDFLDLRQIPVEERNKWQVTSEVQNNYSIEKLNQNIVSPVIVANKLYDFIYFTEVMDEFQNSSFASINKEIVELAEKYKNVRI